MRKISSKFLVNFVPYCRWLSSKPPELHPRYVDLEKKIVYGGDLPVEISTKSVGSLMFHRLAAKERQNKVFQVSVDTKDEMTTGVYLQRAVAVAEKLLEMGIKKRDIVALLGDNSLNMNTAMAGVFFMGAVPLPISPKTTLDAFKVLLKYVKPILFGCDKQYLYPFRRVIELIPNYEYRIFLLDDKKGTFDSDLESFEEFIKGKGKDVSSFKPAEVDDPKKELALVLKSLTDGFVGRGVGITHHNINAVLARYDAKDQGELSSNIILMVQKLAWMSGILSLVISCCNGFTLVVMRDFYEEEFLRAVEEYKVTISFLYSVKLWQLYKYNPIGTYNLSACKFIYALDGVLPLFLIEGLKKKYGLKLRTSYGMSEMTGMILESLGKEKPGSVGKLVSLAYAKVVSSQTGQRVGPNEPGLICFNSPTLSKGYLNDQKSYRELVDKEGFLISGLYGYYDSEGDFFIIDKIDYFIQYKDFKVSPKELESLIKSLDAVKDVVVSGLPHPTDGFLPLAIVALQKNHKISAEEIMLFVQERVLDYKKLRGGVIFITKIPRSKDTGLIKRESVRKVLAKYRSKGEVSVSPSKSKENNPEVAQQ